MRASSILLAESGSEAPAADATGLRYFPLADPSGKLCSDPTDTGRGCPPEELKVTGVSQAASDGMPNFRASYSLFAHKKLLTRFQIGRSTSTITSLLGWDSKSPS